jgi:D-3-phosphoglycerate dehydrogenase / 2-oxoglutarate reductase
MRILVLDSIFDSLDVEEDVAVSLGASLSRWGGDWDELLRADIVVHVRTSIGAEMIGALKRCRVIGRFGTGLDTVDLDAADRAGIAVIGVRDYCVRELASHTIAIALALERRLFESVSLARARHIDWQEFANTVPVKGRECATVIGLGAVGRAVAAALVGLSYEVLAVTEHGADVVSELGLNRVTLDESLARGEFVFLHRPLTNDSARIVNGERLALMKPGALLVNTARLGLVDEAAVAVALREQRLGGIAIDAQLPSASPLRALQDDARVLITPHVGWYSERSARELRAQTIRQSVTAYQPPGG